MQFAPTKDNPATGIRARGDAQRSRLDRAQPRSNRLLDKPGAGERVAGHCNYIRWEQP